VGSKFAHCGRGPNYDCCGILIAGAKAIGYPTVDCPGGYSRLANGELMVLLKQNAYEINISEAKPGDIAVFWFDRVTKEPQHAGLFTESMGIIHAYIHIGKVVEHGMNKFFTKRLCHVLRLHGMED